MSAHTPGDWVFEELRGALVIHAEGPAIAELWRRGNAEQERANARLIAAAPEMLEALRVAVVALAHVSERAGSYKHAYETVSAAIAKATS